MATTRIDYMRFLITLEGEYSVCQVHIMHAADHVHSADFGHYNAYCRPNDGEQWTEFDDSTVCPNLDPNSVITKNAYLLFFRRISGIPRTLANLMSSDRS
jgi:ubiquitin C-terminal hydrolase